MSLDSYPAHDILLASLGERWARGDFRFVQFAPTQSDGTRVFALLEDGGPVWFRVTDLSSFSIARVGSVNITLGLNVLSGTITDAISPALNDSALANWRLFASLRQPTPNQAISVCPVLNSTSVISFKVMRVGANIGLNITSVTVAGSDLSDVDVILSNPHGSDVGVGPHSHTITGHPVTDPGHGHAFAGASAIIYTIDWMIVHK